MISYKQFQELDLRVGKVVRVEEIPKSKKLIKLLVDIGEDEPRQIVAGIKQDYEPEELQGRLIVVLANLEPAKLMGVESRGMLLAADLDHHAILLSPDKEVPPGTKVR